MDNSGSATVVLVHGAGAGAWVWEPVGNELDARGIEHVEVDLPTMDQSREPTLTFHDDADHLRSVLDQLDGPIVLVGNSYGGVVITEASAEHPNVVRLVYLAAFMPDADEEVMTWLIPNCTPDLVAAMSATPAGRRAGRHRPRDRQEARPPAGHTRGRRVVGVQDTADGHGPGRLSDPRRSRLAQDSVHLHRLQRGQQHKTGGATGMGGTKVNRPDRGALRPLPAGVPSGRDR